MQAALMIRAKSRERRKLRLKKGLRAELPSNIATKSIAPFPRYPPASWCAAGRAAWQEAAALSVGGGGAGAGGAARRCSVLGDHPGARRDPRAKWHRTNRVRDASYGSSSESDGEGDGIPGDTWGVARLLYAGLATLAVGLVVYFVGTGDKGFKTPALRLVGPTLIIVGLACCLLRILFCICAKPCCRRRQNYKENRRLSGCVEGEEMPLASGCPGTRAGPAQCSPARRLESSSCDVSSLSSGEEDERMRRYRTASSSGTQVQVQAPHSSPQPQSSPQPPPQAIVVQVTGSSLDILESSSCDVSSLSSGEEDERMRRYRTASSSGTQVQVQAPHSSPQPQSSPQPPPQAIVVQVTGSSLDILESSSCDVSSLSSGEEDERMRRYRTASSSGTQVQVQAPHSSPQPQSSPQPPPQAIVVQACSALRTSPGAPSTSGATGARRPPPRNVSFAGGPDGELVLSPAQLRS